MSNSTLKIWPALIAAITFALLTQPAVAQNHQLVINETSSTMLSVTYDMNPLGVTTLGSDFWSVSTGTITLNAPLFWIEPENPLLANEFSVSPPFGLVFSDSTVNQGATAEPDGFTFVGAGMDATGALIDVKFNDSAGDSPSVPDAGATYSLFGISLMGLAFLRRKFC